MSRGLLYIVFGKKCDEMASHTVAYSRQFTDLPICIVTNIKNRNEKWKEISNVSFVKINDKLENNRDYKTQMNKYTPFDETIYIDCDSVIQRKGIEDIFDTASAETDLILNCYLKWEVGDKVIRLYKKAMIIAGVNLPLNIYNGAFIYFKKNIRVDNFFSTWNQLWKSTGGGREMPALSCSIKKSDINTGVLKKGVFSPDVFIEDSVVQHNYGPDFFDKYSIPKIRLFKNFDGDVTDWNWVEL